MNKISAEEISFRQQKVWGYLRKLRQHVQCKLDMIDNNQQAIYINTFRPPAIIESHQRMLGLFSFTKIARLSEEGSAQGALNFNLRDSMMRSNTINGKILSMICRVLLLDPKPCGITPTPKARFHGTVKQPVLDTQVEFNFFGHNLVQLREQIGRISQFVNYFHCADFPFLFNGFDAIENAQEPIIGSVHEYNVICYALGLDELVVPFMFEERKANPLVVNAAAIQGHLAATQDSPVGFNLAALQIENYLEHIPQHFALFNILRRLKEQSLYSMAFKKSDSFLSDVQDYEKFCLEETIFLQKNVSPDLTIVCSAAEKLQEIIFSLVESKTGISVEPVDPGVYIVTIPRALQEKVTVQSFTQNIQDFLERKIA